MNNKFLLLLITSVYILSTPFFAIDLSVYKASHGIDETQDMFSEEHTVLTSQDEQKVILRKLNSYYDDKIRKPIEKWYLSGKEVITIENESYYFLLCEDETHLLYIFDAERNYIQKYKDKLTFEKIKDYAYVTSYSFTYYLPDEKKDETITAWVESINHNYCGSFDFPVFILNSFSEKNNVNTAYYEYIKDFIIDFIETELNRCNALLTADIDYIFNNETMFACAKIYPFDRELAKELSTKLNSIKIMENKSAIDKRRNINMIITYISPVSRFQSIFTNTEKLSWFAKTRPDIKGELPINEEELEKFLYWKMSISYENFVMIDYFGNPIKIELTPEGLKANSAGKDGIWDTEDDQSYIQTYQSVGMEPLTE